MARRYVRRLPVPCKQCAGLFKQRTDRHLYCSRVCAAMAATTASSAGECEHCGVSFKRRSTNRDAGRFCSRTCAFACLAEKAALAAARKGLLGLLASRAECAYCSAPYRKRGNWKFCGDACRSAASAAAARAAYRILARQCGEHALRECVHCSSPFTPVHGRQLLCSERCANRRHGSGKTHRARARRAGVEYEPVKRTRVFDRDAWRCQVCGARTPKRLIGSTKPNAPELDHRVPLALGGGHTWANVQCACRACNARKGGVLVLGQMPLFANPEGKARTGA